MALEIGAIASTVEDLIGKCLSALDDPQADKAGLLELIAECSAGLAALIEERRSLLTAMRSRIEEIAVLVASQDAVWPEEVARLQALSREIHGRAASFGEG